MEAGVPHALIDVSTPAVHRLSPWTTTGEKCANIVSLITFHLVMHDNDPTYNGDADKYEDV